MRRMAACSGRPLVYLNLTGYAPSPNSLLIHAENQPGNFAPHSGTWNVHHGAHASPPVCGFAPDTRTASLPGWFCWNRASVQGTNALVLNGSGPPVTGPRKSRRVWPGNTAKWFLAYTRSRSQGDLNDFSGFLGNYPMPLIRPNVFSNLSADLPNRFLAWGTVRLPWHMQILPIIEYRNGLPYAQYDVLGNYAGVPEHHAVSQLLFRGCARAEGYQGQPQIHAAPFGDRQ